MSPIKPYWRSLQGERWLVHDDGLTFASFHRLIPDEPVRFGVASYFAGNGAVRTTCPGVMGRVRADEDALYWRTELQNVEPDELLRRHQAVLSDIGLRRELAPAPMTLKEVSNTELFHEKRLVGRSGRTGYSLILSYFVLPTLLAFLATGSHSSLHHPAAAICIGASLFGFMRLVLLPLQRHRTALQTHAKG